MSSLGVDVCSIVQQESTHWEVVCSNSNNSTRLQGHSVEYTNSVTAQNNEEAGVLVYL